MEEFVAKWILEDIAHKINYKQLGVIKGYIQYTMSIGYVPKLAVKSRYTWTVFANLFPRFQQGVRLHQPRCINYQIG